MYSSGDAPSTSLDEVFYFDSCRLTDGCIHFLGDPFLCGAPFAMADPLSTYITYHDYRRYSGIISNRRCILGVRPNAFQIEDIAECKSSSNDQKSKNKPLNIGMIFGISSI